MCSVKSQYTQTRSSTWLFALIVASLLFTPSAAAQSCDEPGIASYAAFQLAGEVYVFACGVHPTGGFENCLILGPEKIFPPIHDFKIKRPTGPVIEVVTPFIATAKFASGKKLEQVQVRDAAGMHAVSVRHPRGGKSLPVDTRSCCKKGEYISTYQDTPVDFGIGKFTGIRISGVIADGETIDITLDPNACRLNEFGDRTTCTLIGPTSLQADLSKQRLSDPAGTNRSIFRVKSTDLPKSLIVYLVKPSTDSGYRIVLQHSDSGGTPERLVVALEKSRSVGGVRESEFNSSLCKTVGDGAVGEPGLVSVLQHTVNSDRESIMVVRNNETSLCASHSAVAVLLINGKFAAHGDISSLNSLIQANAQPGDTVIAVAKAVPLQNGIRCVRLGEVKFSLEQCDLE